MIHSDPVPHPPFYDELMSSTAMMYVNLIVAGVLLLEALVYYALLRRRREWPASIRPSLRLFGLLGSAGLALALAYAMWNIYAQSWVTQSPHFPPKWLESSGGIPFQYDLLSIALVTLATVIAFPLYVAIFSTSRGYPDRT